MLYTCNAESRNIRMDGESQVFKKLHILRTLQDQGGMEMESEVSVVTITWPLDEIRAHLKTIKTQVVDPLLEIIKD